MKYLLTIFFLGNLLFAKNGHADDVFWVALKPYFTYQDASQSFGDRNGIANEIYLMVRLNNRDEATWAELRSTNMYAPHSGFVFTADEVAQLKVEKEFLDDYSVKTFPIDTRIASWLANFVYTREVGRSILYRAPTFTFAALNPRTAILNFVRKESNRFFASTLKMDGTIIDGRPCQIKIGFWQRLLMVP